MQLAGPEKIVLSTNWINLNSGPSQNKNGTNYKKEIHKYIFILDEIFTRADITWVTFFPLSARERYPKARNARKVIWFSIFRTSLRGHWRKCDCWPGKGWLIHAKDGTKSKTFRPNWQHMEWRVNCCRVSRQKAALLLLHDTPVPHM